MPRASARAKQVQDHGAMKRTDVGTLVAVEHGSQRRHRKPNGELSGSRAGSEYDPCFPLPNEAWERFAIAMAEGHTRASASRTAGFQDEYAYLLLKRDAEGTGVIRDRIQVLRDTAVSVLPSAAALFTELHQAAKAAIAEGKFRDGLSSLQYLHGVKDRSERETLDTHGESTRLSTTRVPKRFPARSKAVVETERAEDEEAAEAELRAMQELDGMLEEAEEPAS